MLGMGLGRAQAYLLGDLGCIFGYLPKADVARWCIEATPWADEYKNN
jgi:hypothetical protein